MIYRDIGKDLRELMCRLGINLSVGSWNVDGGHLEAGLVQTGSLAQLLSYLDEHLLSVRLSSRFICLRQVEPNNNNIYYSGDIAKHLEKFERKEV